MVGEADSDTPGLADDGDQSEFESWLQRVADSQLESGASVLPRPGEVIAGRYRIVKRIGAGGMGVVDEAIDLERDVRVALKTLRTTNAQTLYRFKHEFRALAELMHPRLVPLFELFADEDGRWFFSMELIDDGVDLLGWIRSGAVPVVADAKTQELAGHSTTWLAIPDRGETLSARPRASVPPDYTRLRQAFGQLADGVCVLHAAGRLHRDLKPENVFVRRGSGEVVLLDFGLVAALDDPRVGGEQLIARTPAPAAGSSSQAYHATQAGSIAGTIAYMAPEQTLAQPLTAAADWYAVGVMLYEALTGRLPFEGNTAQLISDKQSREPARPSLLSPDTPGALDELCMELLSRDPARRPTGNLVAARLRGDGDPAEASTPRPRSLFVGRDHELAALARAFEEASSAPFAVHVRGRSGAGKSALLAHFLGELALRSDTLVLSGRCYEQEFIPFKAVDSLMDALTHYLLQCPAEVASALLPEDAELLARVFPVIGRLLPAAPAQRDDSDLQALRRRAFAAMRELLGKLSRRVRLVLCIDDLQWGDVDSIALLAEVLRSPEAPPLLLVLAYRSEHVDKSTCLRALAEVTLQRELTLDVGGLGEVDARQLAQRLLDRDRSEATLDWVTLQAAGSAFLIQELAQHVAAGGALASAEGLGLDDILWQRVLLLPEQSRALLTVVAAAGRPVRLRHAQRAAGIANLGPRAVASLRAERLARTDGTGLGTEIEPFHDRVRESIVARTPAADIARHCGALGRAIEEGDDGDAETLAALFELAGEPGHASGYYARAVPRAVGALAFDRVAALTRKAIELARSDAEIATAYEAAIHAYTDMARFADAYAFTREGMGVLGVELPASFAPPLFIRDVLAVQLRMRGKRPASLLELPTMPEGRLKYALKLANAGAKAAFQVRPELCVALGAKLVRHCLAHGNSAHSATGYMAFGTIFLGGIMGWYEAGYEYGQLALALIDKYQYERQRSEVSFVVGYFGTSWLRPAREAEALWQTAYEAGRATGDLFHMGCAAAGRLMSLHMRGVALDELEREAQSLTDALAQNGLRESLAVVLSVRQAARDLRGLTRSPGSWQDDDYDEQSQIAWSTFGGRHFAHYCGLARAQSFYLWGDLNRAAETLDQAQQLAPASRGMLHSAEHVLIQALVRAARHATQPFHEQLRTRVALSRAAAKLRRWARRCPANFEHKAELVRAEAQRIAGHESSALAGYARAAESARRFGYLQIEALAHLLSARLQAARGKPAEPELEQARASLRSWGATALAERC